MMSAMIGHRRPNRQRALRLKLRDVLYRLKPDADAFDIFNTVEKVLRAVEQEPLAVLAEDPVPGCGCWLCVLRLNAWVAQETARRVVEQEDVEWVATER